MVRVIPLVQLIDELRDQLASDSPTIGKREARKKVHQEFENFVSDHFSCEKNQDLAEFLEPVFTTL